MYSTARRELLDVEMPDGVRLATSVSLPEPGFRGPALLLRSPYPFLSFAESTLGLDLTEVLARGFAVVRQDVRGRGGSGGRFGFLGQEGPDGRATLAWMTEQGWCDGRVATIGGSYLGRVQLLMGDRSDPAPVAMIPALTGLGSTDTWRPGGVLSLPVVTGWLRQLAEPDPRGLSREEAAVVRALLERDEPLAVLEAVLDESHPANRLMESLLPLLRSEEGPELEARAPTVPSLHVTGWYDHTAATTIDAWQAAQRGGDHHHLIVGPWSHENFGGRLAGLDHPGGDAATWGLSVQQLDFLRFAIDGEGEPPPAVQVYVTGASEWRVLPSWPPSTFTRTLFLDAHTGDLVTATPEPGILEFDSRTATPFPTVGGPLTLPSDEPEAVAEFRGGPADISELLDREDVLVLRSPLLPEALELAGTVELNVTIETDLAPAGLIAKLAETAPDGTVRVLTDGVGADSSAPSNTPAELRIELSPIHHLVQAGRSLVLLLAASEFPRYALGLDADRRIRVHTGGSSPACLRLPVVSV